MQHAMQYTILLQVPSMAVQYATIGSPRCGATVGSRGATATGQSEGGAGETHNRGVPSRTHRAGGFVILAHLYFLREPVELVERVNVWYFLICKSGGVAGPWDWISGWSSG